MCSDESRAARSSAASFHANAGRRLDGGRRLEKCRSTHQTNKKGDVWKTTKKYASGREARARIRHRPSVIRRGPPCKIGTTGRWWWGGGLKWKIDNKRTLFGQGTPSFARRLIGSWISRRCEDGCDRTRKPKRRRPGLAWPETRNEDWKASTPAVALLSLFLALWLSQRVKTKTEATVRPPGPQPGAFPSRFASRHSQRSDFGPTQKQLRYRIRHLSMAYPGHKTNTTSRKNQKRARCVSRPWLVHDLSTQSIGVRLTISPRTCPLQWPESLRRRNISFWFLGTSLFPFARAKHGLGFPNRFHPIKDQFTLMSPSFHSAYTFSDSTRKFHRVVNSDAFSLVSFFCFPCENIFWIWTKRQVSISATDLGFSAVPQRSGASQGAPLRDGVVEANLSAIGSPAPREFHQFGHGLHLLCTSRRKKTLINAETRSNVMSHS